MLSVATEGYGRVRQHAGSRAPMTEEPTPDDTDLTEQLAQCEREDTLLLRLVLAAVLAVALLGLAGALVP